MTVGSLDFSKPKVFQVFNSVTVRVCQNWLWIQILWTLSSTHIFSSAFSRQLYIATICQEVSQCRQRSFNRWKSGLTLKDFRLRLFPTMCWYIINHIFPEKALFCTKFMLIIAGRARISKKLLEFGSKFGKWRTWMITTEGCYMRINHRNALT